MRIGFVTRITVVPTILLLGVASTALGQQMMSLREKGIQPYSVELKPLSNSFSMVPGPGLAAEAFVSDKVSLFVQGNYMDVDMPGTRAEDYGLDDEDMAVIKQGYGFNTAAGARWYASPAENSWYLGGGVGYTHAKAKWEYSDTRVDSTLYSVVPGLVGGYRWVFRNNFLLRLGAGAAANAVQSSSATAENQTAANAAKAEEKVEDVIKQNVIASLDLGLGYAF